MRLERHAGAARPARAGPKAPTQAARARDEKGERPGIYRRRLPRCERPPSHCALPVVGTRDAQPAAELDITETAMVAAAGAAAPESSAPPLVKGWRVSFRAEAEHTPAARHAVRPSPPHTNLTNHCPARKLRQLTVGGVLALGRQAGRRYRAVQVSRLDPGAHMPQPVRYSSYCWDTVVSSHCAAAAAAAAAAAVGGEDAAVVRFQVNVCQAS